MKTNSIIKWGTISAFFPFAGLFITIKDNKVNSFPIVFCIFFFIGSQTILNDLNDIGRDVINFSILSKNENIDFWTLVSLKII